MAATQDDGPASLRTLIYTDDDPTKPPKLQVLDQLLIPHEKTYIDIPDAQKAWSVIRNMQIRGAPLIAIVACLGLAADLRSEKTAAELDSIEKMNGADNFDALYIYMDGKMKYLATSRPTAVNLFNALAELKDQLQKAKDDTSEEGLSIRQRMVKAVSTHAKFMLERDTNDCITIGKVGADEILKDKEGGNKVTLMTICNTGSLATSYYGTALGVVRAVRDRDQLGKIVALETRPYNQGSRLTSFEIVEEKMPGGTLICDSMAAAFMSNEKVDACVVGADRVCANGDTANKIGTYSLSLIAAAHNVPFYVASPFTTLDVSKATGAEIPIEERPPDELLSTSKAPKDIGVWNPAFDVTPAKFITGIVTEKGLILRDAEGKIDVAGFVKQHTV